MSLAEEAREVRQRIADRLAELEPLVREYNELVKLAGEMGVEQQPVGVEQQPLGVEQQPVWVEQRPVGLDQQQEGAPSAGTAGRPASSSARARRRGGSRANARGSRAATGRAGDDIAALVLEAVRAEPGKTVADYAEGLNMNATALYRPVRNLTDQGVLVKRARQLFPA